MPVLVVWSSFLPRGWWSPLPVIKEEDNVPIFTGEIEKDFKGWGKKVTIVKQIQYGLMGLVGLKKEISVINYNVFKLTKQQLVILVPTITSHCCVEKGWVACLNFEVNCATDAVTQYTVAGSSTLLWSEIAHFPA